MARRRTPGAGSSLLSLRRLLVLWLAGAALRLTVLAVPPVLPLIHKQFELGERAVGALSGLPVLLFGLGAILGALSIARLGARRAAVAGLIVVAAASAARGVGPSAPMLFAMTFLMAAGVAFLQPALPALVGEWFPTRPGFATAVYANGLLIGEAAPAALTIPLILPLVGGSWPASFAVWAVPPAMTAFMLARIGPGQPERAAPAATLLPARWWPDWSRPEPWLLGLMQGGTGGLYFASNAFIPDYLHAIGRPGLVTAGLAALNIGQLPASLLLLVAARRLGLSKGAVAAMQVVGLGGLAALVAAGPSLAVLGAGVVGFCCAFTLIVTLALPPQLVATRDVPRLAAGMFAVGYSFSFLVPLIGGALWDATGVPAAAFLAPAASGIIVLASALVFRFPAPGIRHS